MSAEVETMMSGNRQVPWHGLGEIVEGTLCSADAIKKAGLDWRVTSNPMYTEGGMLIPNYKANIRETDNKVLGVVSDRYQIVQNSDAFDFTDAMIGEGCQYETAGSLFGGKKIFLLAKTDTVKILDDEVEPYMCFTNNHDGFGSIKCCCTNVRVVCNNTLNLALSTAKRSWSCTHTGNLQSKLSEAQYALELAHNYTSELSKFAERAANFKIDEDATRKAIAELFNLSQEISERAQRNREQAVKDFERCLVMPDITKFNGTAWGFINAASDFAYHRPSARMTATYQDNKMNQAIIGNEFLDRATALFPALMK